ncbi:hypothetical protein D3C81_1531730 [compost metagenome]
MRICYAYPFANLITFEIRGFQKTFRFLHTQVGQVLYEGLTRFLLHEPAQMARTDEEDRCGTGQSDPGIAQVLFQIRLHLMDQVPFLGLSFRRNRLGNLKDVRLQRLNQLR